METTMSASENVAAETTATRPPSRARRTCRLPKRDQSAVELSKNGANDNLFVDTQAESALSNGMDKRLHLLPDKPRSKIARRRSSSGSDMEEEEANSAETSILLPRLKSAVVDAVTYKVGDYCFFETSASGPCQIRKIDELIKHSNGSIDVKVFIYSRRCDLPPFIQRQMGYIIGEEEFDESNQTPQNQPVDTRVRRQLSSYSQSELTEHWISGREVFLNRDAYAPMMEILPASLLRGKCDILHHIQGLPKQHFLLREDTFYFERTWYPPESGKREPGHLLKERDRRIHFDRKGSFQPRISALLNDAEKVEYEQLSDHATPCWRPNNLPHELIDNFVKAVAAVGLLARCALTTSPSVQETPYAVARLAGRDASQIFAMDLLHRYGYDLSKCLNVLVGKELKYRQCLLESFDERDMAYFMQGLAETGRNLPKIHSEWMPWRKLSDIVVFYYLYKCTPTYRIIKEEKTQQKKEKGVVRSLRVVKSNSRSSVLENLPANQICHSCDEPSDIWYGWIGCSRFRGHIRPFCADCWHFWKHYGIMRRPWKKCQKTRRSFSSPIKSSGSSKPHLITQRSPPPPLDRFSGRSSGASEKQSKQEFVFQSRDEWILARRVATENWYEPKKLARRSDFGVKEMDKSGAYYRACPPFVVDYYRRPMRRKTTSIEEAVRKINSTKTVDL